MKQPELFNAERLKTLADTILLLAKKNGASQACVSMDANQGFSISARNQDVENIEYQQDKSIQVTVYFKNRVGVASTTDIRPIALEQTVKAACHLAQYTDEDPCAGLPDSSELAMTYPDIPLCMPWEISVEDAIQKAIECERIALSQDARLSAADNISLATAHSWHLTANSLGFVGYFPYTRHEMNCVMVAKSKSDMQRDYHYTVACDSRELISIEELAKIAAKKTVDRLNARRIPTQRCPVIFMPEEARGFIGSFFSAISGGKIYRRSSFLLDQIGKMIFPSWMTLQEKPHLSFALGSAPFDDDGVLTRDNIFVDQGQLKQYALGVYAARQLNLKTTGNSSGAHNVVVPHQSISINQLIKKMGRGLIVTEQMGSGINYMTGDYSRGVTGFWVDKGEIQFPVHEVTIAGNLLTMYQQIEAISDDVDVRGNIRTGSILIQEMTVAGE